MRTWHYNNSRGYTNRNQFQSFRSTPAEIHGTSQQHSFPVSNRPLPHPSPPAFRGYSHPTSPPSRSYGRPSARPLPPSSSQAHDRPSANLTSHIQAHVLQPVHPTQSPLQQFTPPTVHLTSPPLQTSVPPSAHLSKPSLPKRFPSSSQKKTSSFQPQHPPSHSTFSQKTASSFSVKNQHAFQSKIPPQTTTPSSHQQPQNSGLPVQSKNIAEAYECTTLTCLCIYVHGISLSTLGKQSSMFKIRREMVYS